MVARCGRVFRRADKPPGNADIRPDHKQHDHETRDQRKPPEGIVERAADFTADLLPCLLPVDDRRDDGFDLEQKAPPYR